MPESHTSENLADGLKATFQNWNLQGKKITGNSDNAKNILNAFDILEIISIGCIGHIINLAAGKVLSLNKVSSLVARVKRLVSHFHYSCISSNLLSINQKKFPESS